MIDDHGCHHPCGYIILRKRLNLPEESPVSKSLQRNPFGLGQGVDKVGHQHRQRLLPVLLLPRSRVENSTPSRAASGPLETKPTLAQS